VPNVTPSIYPILHNARCYAEQRVQSRPGLVKLGGQYGGVAANLHSIRRLNDAFNISAPFARILGVANSLYLATSTIAIDTGYSGNPLSMVPFRPSQSPEAWMYIGDSKRMRKVLTNGTNFQMGIAPPLLPPNVEFGLPAVTTIDDFESIGAWTPGGTAGALSVVSRYSGNAGRIIYDSGTTGWASIWTHVPQLASVLAGTHLTITQASPAESEIFQVQEVLAPAFAGIATIAGVAYDNGSSGPCTLTLELPPTAAPGNQGYTPGIDAPAQRGAGLSRIPTNNAVGIRNNCLLSDVPNSLPPHTIAHFYQVDSFSLNSAGLVSIRTSTINTLVAGDQLVAQPCIRAYLVNNYPITEFTPIFDFPVLSDNALQSTLTVGKGTISESIPLNLGIVQGQNLPIQPTDYIHISFQIDNAANLVEFRLIFDVDSDVQDFQHTYYFKSWSGSDIQQALLGNTTIQQARQQSYTSQVINQNIGVVPGSITLGPGLIISIPTINEPATVLLGQGSNYPFAGQLNPAGASGWAELYCQVSDLTLVGPDATATLANVNGVRIQITVASQAVCAIDSAWIGGCYGPDIGQTGVPYLYRFQPRSSFTGAKGYPSPPTRIGIAPHAQAIEVDMAQHPDPQVDSLDVYRWGGTLPSWNYVGTAPNSASPTFEDVFSDTALQSAPQLSFDNLQPFPTIDVPHAGFVSVVGNAVQWRSGDQFNSAWAQGTQIIINGLPYTFFTQPTSGIAVQIVENGGTQVNVPYSIAEATILGQPLPVLWGPYSQGTAAYLFACGDTYQPGVLFLTNGNDPDSASDIYQIEITSPSEPLMNGCMYDGQSYVWSSERMFFLYPSFGSGVAVVAGELLPAQGTNLFVPQEVPNGKGLFARYAVAVGPKMWFRARDGIYETTGGAPTNITVAELGLLFPHDGQPGVAVTVGTFTFYPPDDTQLNKQRLSYYDSNLYFDYVDTQGNQTTIVVNTATTPYVFSKDDYTPQVVTHYGEEGAGIHSLLCGGVDANLWQASGAVDGNTLPFPFEARMPQMSELVGGFQHVRDGYLGLIESAAASLVVNVDGTDNTIALPSVAGAYKRIYTVLPALKGRLFNFALIGTSPFAMIQRDAQMSMRNWGADGPYEPINPFSNFQRAIKAKVG
jgi:hypothetical protein